MSVDLQVKYVIVEPPHLPGLLVPVILPACVEHSTAAATGRPVSAGFVRQDPTAEHGVFTYGFSTGLSLKPDPKDALIISKWLAQLVRLPATATESPREGART